jgi:hypothetical protein
MKIRPCLGIGAVLAALAAPVGAATFSVVNTSDGGLGSLRQAILDANANLGADSISFAIAGSGLQTIHALDTMIITDAVVIDGFTQSGALPNLLAVGNNAIYPIEIDGTGVPFTQEQMAVFLLRTQGGRTYTPPACVTPTFNDVPCSSGFAKWIEELARRGIATGCGNNNFCPHDLVTRGQMAVFVVTTLGLP